MSRFNSYPDGYILQPGDRIIVSRQGRTLSVTGAGITAGAVPAEQFDDYKRYNDARVQALTAQNSRLIALVEAATGTPLPSLNALYLSTTAFTAGTMFNATIAGATPGSTITATADDGTTLNVTGGLLSGTFTTAGPKAITLTEALDGYFNSPNPTLVQVAVAGVGTPTPTPTLNALTVSPSSATVGAAYSGTINGLTSGSSIALSGAGAAGLSIAGGVITGTPTTAGSVNIIETLAGATGSPRPSNSVVTVAVATGTPYTVMFVGSSTPEKYFTNPIGTNPPVNDKVTWSTDGTNFTQFTTTGLGALTFGDALQKGLNRPVRLVSKGDGGSVLRHWEANTNGVRDPAVAAGLASNPDVIISIVGFNDAKSNYTADQAALELQIKSFFTKLRNEINKPNLPILMGVSQSFGDGAYPLEQDDDFDSLHAGELAVIASEPTVYFGAHAYDLTQLSDNIHMNLDQYPIHARRLASNLLRVINGQAEEKGPRVVSVRAISDTSTEVTIAHDTGTNFTPTTNPSGVRVFAGSTLLAITSITKTSATTLEIVHASAGGIATSVTMIGGAVLKDKNVIRDNSLLALPINPAPRPITAPSAGTGNPALNLSPASPSVASNAAAGTFVSNVGNVPTGSTPSVTPSDGRLVIAGDASTGWKVVVGTSALSAGTLSFTVAATGATSATGTLTITAASSGTARTARVNYSTTSGTDVAGWNRWNGVATPAVASPLTALVDTTGVATAWSITQLDALTGPSTNGAVTGSNTGVYPDEVMRTYWYAAANARTRFDVQGLDPSKLYTLRFFGSRRTDNRSTDYTVGSTVVTLDNKDNTTRTVEISNLAPNSSGLIEFNFINTPAFGSFSFLNALEIIQQG